MHVRIVRGAVRSAAFAASVIGTLIWAQSAATTPSGSLAHTGADTIPWVVVGIGVLAVAQGGSSRPFARGYRAPVAMTRRHIDMAIHQFAAAAERAAADGFRLLELHAGHGRLLHSFLYPVANRRTDRYGDGFTGLTLLLRRTVRAVRAVRAVWPGELLLAVGLSATDFVAGGWTLKDTVRLVPLLAEDGADLIDCTSGGITRPEPRPTGPAWQAPHAAAVRRATGVSTAAVGKITTVAQADRLLTEEQCDVALMGRQLLIEPMERQYTDGHSVHARRLDVQVGSPSARGG
ncbi:hypothetical protein ACFXP3_27230 [Streptomyces sp. NPDC059096]|uniref:oxidoreductase n=1 Tax=Streptomyces sp. NPDC059096 TaxID=3346727 RepID=UPI0036968F47